METKNLRFETLQLHVGQENPDPVTNSRAVPIYQTTSYVFNDSAHAAARFGLQDAGNIYGRLTNSTQAVLEERIAALEGGVAALAVASGAAAVTYAFQNITKAGDHIVSVNTIYGGTYNLLAHTLENFGIHTSFVEPNLNAIENAITDKTKAVFIESLGNPHSNILDIQTIRPDILRSSIWRYCKTKILGPKRNIDNCSLFDAPQILFGLGLIFCESFLFHFLHYSINP